MSKIDQKIKIIHIITKLELGGAQLNTIYTLQHLDRGLFEPILITGAEGKLLPEAFNINALNTHVIGDLVRELNPVKDFKAFISIMKILRNIAKKSNGKKVIVHTHSSKAGIIGRWAAYFSSVTTIIHTFHGFGFNDYQNYFKRKLFIYLERISAKISDKLIVVSKANMVKALKLRIGKENQYTLIRSGIKIIDFSEAKVSKHEARKNINVTDESPLIGCISCFKPQKDLISFIQIAKEVNKKLPDTKFVLVGDGEQRGQIECEIKKLGLENSFLLLGWRKDIPVIMRAIDLLLHTSLWEGLPRVFPEAMASGVPIIATRVDGAEEAIENGKNGYLFLPEEKKIMAEKIVELINHPELLHELGNAGRNMVHKFCIDAMVREQERLYLSF